MADAEAMGVTIVHASCDIAFPRRNTSSRFVSFAKIEDEDGVPKDKVRMVLLHTRTQGLIFPLLFEQTTHSHRSMPFSGPRCDEKLRCSATLVNFAYSKSGNATCTLRFHFRNLDTSEIVLVSEQRYVFVGWRKEDSSSRCVCMTRVSYCFTRCRGGS